VRRVLVTGVSRRAGIGAAIARRLATDGWDVVAAGWRPYDDRMPWGRDDGPEILEADLADPDAPGDLVRRAGPLRALVLAHCESVDSGIADTTVESFDRHMAVNARAAWLLLQAFARQHPGGGGGVVSITSDHTAGNLPYGASKGAMDRIVLAAAPELAHLGVTANVVNPGPTQTGWIDAEHERELAARTAGGRVGEPDDCARLVAWLLSEDGRWVNGQLISSNGGFRL
jgi:3-oxoacyl-[acyl-carrier protein] reductase